jgi:hypothetical protein
VYVLRTMLERTQPSIPTSGRGIPFEDTPIPVMTVHPPSAVQPWLHSAFYTISHALFLLEPPTRLERVSFDYKSKILPLELRRRNHRGERVSFCPTPSQTGIFPYTAIEADDGFEPSHRGFADLDLTTWLIRRTLHLLFIYFYKTVLQLIP